MIKRRVVVSKRKKTSGPLAVIIPFKELSPRCIMSISKNLRTWEHKNACIRDAACTRNVT